MSSYFIDYTKRSKGFKFYDPRLRNIFETGIGTFFENIEFLVRNKVKTLFLKKNWFFFLNLFIQLFLLSFKIR